MIKLFVLVKYSAGKVLHELQFMDVFFRISRPYGRAVEQFAKY